MMTLRTVLISFSWQTVSIIVQAVCQLAVMAILARYLNAEEFGIIAATNVVIMFVQMLSEAGVGSVLVQRENIDKQLIAAAMHLSLLIGIIFTGVIIVSADLIEVFFDINNLALYVKALSISFIFVALYKIPESILQREMKFDVLMKLNLVSYLLGFVTPALYLGINGFGVWSLVIASLGQIVVKVIVLNIAKSVKVFKKVTWNTYKDVLGFGAGVTSIRIWSYFYRQGDRLVLGRIMSVEQLGEYHLANQLSFLPGQYVGNVIDSVLFPVMSRLRQDKEKLSQLLVVSQMLALYCMTALGLFLSIFGKDIVQLVYGGQWSSIVVIFQVLCLGAGVRSATRMSDITNRALGRLKAASASKFLSALFFISSVYYASSIGLKEVSFAVLASNIIALILASTVAMVNINVQLRMVIISLIKVLSCCGVIFILFNELYIQSIIAFEDLLIRLLIVTPLGIFITFSIGYLVYRKDVIKLRHSVFD